jgi:hypothetical protein
MKDEDRFQEPTPVASLVNASLSTALRTQSFGANEGHEPLYPSLWWRAAPTCHVMSWHGTKAKKLTDIRAQIRLQNAQAAGDSRTKDGKGSSPEDGPTCLIGRLLRAG